MLPTDGAGNHDLLAFAPGKLIEPAGGQALYPGKDHDLQERDIASAVGADNGQDTGQDPVVRPSRRRKK